MNRLKLSSGIASNPTLSKIASFIESAQIMFSSVVYKKDNLSYLIKKNEKTPYIQLDWKMYCIMRSWARTLISSGQNLRYEKGIYLDLQTFGDKDLEELFQKNRKIKQNVIVFSRKLSQIKIQEYINPQFYQYLSIPNKLIPGTQPPYKLSDVIKQAKKYPNSCPILMQAGINVTSQLINEDSELLDLLIISQFEGYMPNQSIGEQFELNIEKKYAKIWQSQTIQIDVKNQQKAKITFIVYAPHNKINK